eukprot:TRINITY_DN11290_c0_g1_i10.p4 TRINITY_DN11290_c0_g1~~TRINITY_DN11290_c0_g1_i10.p4  ORF type:complete len:128 (+),score=5.66 TRINITY_DN11290_c0_g1_i10:1308-1691(+)
MALASINGSEAAGSSNSHFEAVDAVKFQMSLLHLACDDQDVTSAARLLQRGENVDARDIDGWTPLLYACCMGNERLVKTLLDFGASVNAITKVFMRINVHRLSAASAGARPKQLLRSMWPAIMAMLT